MNNKYFISIIYLALVPVFLFSQRLEQNNTTYDELRPILENASRSQQIVWVEDFTGLN